jgi:uncharacterized protein YceK
MRNLQHTTLQHTMDGHSNRPENHPGSGNDDERVAAHAALEGALTGALRGFLLAIGVLLVVCPILLMSGCASVGSPAAQSAAAASRVAEFHGTHASADAVRVANWIAASGDNAGMAFVIVDKKMAKVYVFDALAQLRGASSVNGVSRG